MTQRSQQQRISIAGAEPNPATMQVGQIVINIADGKAWTKNVLGELVLLYAEPSDGTGSSETPRYRVRGVTGDYVLAPTDNNTLLSFVSRATLAIPAGVSFPSGFRCWIRQGIPDPDYVYIKPDQSILVQAPIDPTSPGNAVNSTKDQYHVIELVNIAGGTWAIMNADGAEYNVEHPPVGEDAYIPETGVVTTSGKATNLNLSGQLTATKEFALRTFIKLSPVSETEPPPVPPPPTPGSFTVYQTVQPPGKPSDAWFRDNYGILRLRTSYAHNDMFESSGYPSSNWTEAEPTAQDNTIFAQRQGSDPVMIDYEYQFLGNVPRDSLDASTPITDADRVRFNDAATRIWQGCKDAMTAIGKTQPLGYYSRCPYTEYFASRSTATQSKIDAWQRRNSFIQGFGDVMDIHCPNFYIMYYAESEWPIYYDVVNGTLNEGHRLWPNKQRWAIIWPQVHPNDSANRHKYASYDGWYGTLQTLRDHPYCDAAVIWGLDKTHGLPGMSASEAEAYQHWNQQVQRAWWQATVDFMATLG